MMIVERYFVLARVEGEAIGAINIMLDDDDNDAITVALSSQASFAIKDLEGGDDNYQPFASLV